LPVLAMRINLQGVYFFPGDPKEPWFFTSHSNKQGRDYAWSDSGPLGFDARKQIIAEIAAVGANVIFAQYSGAYSDVHFVNNTEAAFLGVFYSSKLVNGPLVIPSLERLFSAEGSVQRMRHLSSIRCVTLLHRLQQARTGSPIWSTRS
jgi:hypothetical protein